MDPLKSFDCFTYLLGADLFINKISSSFGGRIYRTFFSKSEEPFLFDTIFFPTNTCKATISFRQLVIKIKNLIPFVVLLKTRISNFLPQSKLKLAKSSKQLIVIQPKVFQRQITIQVDVLDKKKEGEVSHDSTPLELFTFWLNYTKKDSVTKVIADVRKMREEKSYIPPETEKPYFERGFLPALAVCAQYASIPLPQTNYYENPSLRRIFKNGLHVMAHGVEDGKAGILGFLNIILEGMVIGKYYGSLMRGDPSYVAGPHGPYYIIYRAKKIEKNKPSDQRLKKHIYSDQYHKAYLVPNDEIKRWIIGSLEKAVHIQMLTANEQQKIVKKIYTYQEFLHHKAMHHHKNHKRNLPFSKNHKKISFE